MIVKGTVRPANRVGPVISAYLWRWHFGLPPGRRRTTWIPRQVGMSGRMAGRVWFVLWLPPRKPERSETNGSESTLVG